MSSKNLPQVSKETVLALAGSWGEGGNEYLSNEYNRLTKDQPELTEQIAAFIICTVADKKELEEKGTNAELTEKQKEVAMKMLDSYVVTYLLLEAQAEADHLKDTFGPLNPEN